MTQTVERPLVATCVPREVRTPADVEALRVLRNEARFSLTRDHSYLTRPQQAAWWAGHDPSRIRVCLYETAVLIGYGLLRQDAGRWVCTVVVAPEWRGQGHGTAIYRHLAEWASADVWAEILLDNHASRRACEKAGYVLVETGGADTVLYVRRLGQ